MHTTKSVRTESLVTSFNNHSYLANPVKVFNSKSWHRNMNYLNYESIFSSLSVNSLTNCDLLFSGPNLSANRIFTNQNDCNYIL